MSALVGTTPSTTTQSSFRHQPQSNETYSQCVARVEKGLELQEKIDKLKAQVNNRQNEMNARQERIDTNTSKLEKLNQMRTQVQENMNEEKAKSDEAAAKIAAMKARLAAAMQAKQQPK